MDVQGDIHFWGLGGLWDTLWERKPVVHVFCSAIWTQTQTLSRPCLSFHIVRGAPGLGADLQGSGFPAL